MTTNQKNFKTGAERAHTPVKKNMTYFKKVAKKYDAEIRKSMEEYLNSGNFIEFNAKILNDFFVDKCHCNTWSKAEDKIFAELIPVPTPEQKESYNAWLKLQYDLQKPIQEQIKEAKAQPIVQPVATPITPQDSPKTPVIEPVAIDKKHCNLHTEGQLNQITYLVVNPKYQIFDVNPAIVDALAEDMRINGWNSSTPIIIWNWIVIDGHTRLEAAKKAGIDIVTTFEINFKSEADAYAYAWQCQTNRRNISDVEIIKIILTLEKRERGGQSGVHNDTNKQDCSLPLTGAEIAKKFGMSLRKLVDARMVAAKADAKLLDDVRTGKKTINKAANKIKDAEKGTKEKTEKVEEKVPETKYDEAVSTVYDDVVDRFSNAQIKELINKLTLYLE